MAGERLKRQIERILDVAQEAISKFHMGGLFSMPKQS